ncbi:MAG: acyl-CoA dehydrogenase family protein, partial [Stackebrandtia sp.]
MHASRTSPASPDAQGTPPDQLLAAATALVPLLAEQAEEGERQRRISDITAKALRDAGMFRLGTPARFGGHSAGVRRCMEVTAELARGDGSASWIAMVFTGTSLIAGLMDRHAQIEVWDRDPDAAVAGALTPGGSSRDVGYGVAVSGRWRFVSGVDHAQWAILAVAAAAPDHPPQIVLVPLAELTVEDTWHVAGMRGTGSNTVVADDVFVPARRMALSGFATGTPTLPESQAPSDAWPLGGVLAVVLLGPLLGVAEAALA